jgi:hypothetical protein
MTNYIAEIETRVAGIPCLIGVTHYEAVNGSYAYNADSDWDYEGYTESEWEVLDSRGRPAPWLTKKLTSKIESEIEQEIAEYFN